MNGLELISSIVILLFCLLGLFGFALFKQPVHAALSFSGSIISGGAFYLFLDAPYLAISTVIVYAGATIIIFLFALMFAQQPTLSEYDSRLNHPILAASMALGLLGVLIWGIASESSQPTIEVPDNKVVAISNDQTNSNSVTIDNPHSGSVSSLGRTLYTRYLWAVELAGTLLLVAALGAVVVSKESISKSMTHRN